MELQLNKLNKFGKLHFAVSAINDGNMSFLYGEKSEVLENRKKFLKKAGLSLDDCLTMRLQHADGIKLVDKESLGLGMYEIESAPKADSLITSKENLGLFLVVADCIPAIVFDPSKEAIALVHLGWRNTDVRLAQKTIVKMIEKFDSKPQDLLVALGPGIHKESYRKDEVLQSGSSDWQKYLTKEADGLTSIDMYGYNKQQLLDVDILKQNIFISDIDTYSSKNLFSHLRSQITKKPEGRFAVVAYLK